MMGAIRSERCCGSSRGLVDSGEPCTQTETETAMAINDRERYERILGVEANVGCLSVVDMYPLLMLVWVIVEVSADGTDGDTQVQTLAGTRTPDQYHVYPLGVKSYRSLRHRPMGPVRV